MEKEIERLIESSIKALVELDKIIVQPVEDDLDPEKGKIMAEGKLKAIDASQIIIDKINNLKLSKDERETEQDPKEAAPEAPKRSFGPEGRAKN